VTIATDAPRDVTRTTVRAHWSGGQRYDISHDDGPIATIDGNRGAGPGPVGALLGALAACASMDVVGYLEKRRTPVEQLEIVVHGERRATEPRRVLSALLEFQLRGETIEVIHATRAIDLAVQTYCSVASSLAPDIVIETQLVLNGETHPKVRQNVLQVGR
jgi:putative redox protein